MPIAPWAPPGIYGVTRVTVFRSADTGWLQIYCETSQEALDTIIMAYKASEQLMLPIMVMIDGFILSHTMERLLIPEQKMVDDYLPAYRAPYQLDPDNPMTFGAAALNPISFTN